MHTKKHLGQHFLRDAHAVGRILDALEAAPGEHFLEIGPGPATLTLPFSRRGFPLTVVETDRDMVAYLEAQDFPSPVTIHHADALEIPLDGLLVPPTKVFSNLPYNVSVPITARLLAYSPAIPLMVLMYQKEVAERIRAREGCKEYGPISVLCAVFYTIDWHLSVKPGAFHPPPKVMSQVIRLRRLEQPLLAIEHLERFTQLLRFLFNHRRKMISSNLKHWHEGWTTAQTLLESMVELGLDPSLRAENISPHQYVDWFNRAVGAS